MNKRENFLPDFRGKISLYYFLSFLVQIATCRYLTPFHLLGTTRSYPSNPTHPIPHTYSSTANSTASSFKDEIFTFHHVRRRSFYMEDGEASASSLLEEDSAKGSPRMQVIFGITSFGFVIRQKLFEKHMKALCNVKLSFRFNTACW